MVQFNLLPDVKQEYIKSVYRRRLITLACFAIGSMFLVIFILMFLYVRVNQTRHLSNLDTDIKKGVAELQQNRDLDKILTIQNQLSSLPQLHNQKVMTSRIFDYLSQLTPVEASVTSVDIDIENKKILLKGKADTLITVNKFVDTVKFTDFVITGEEIREGKAFSSVVLQEFSIEDNAVAQEGVAPTTTVNYQIEFVYDEAIFKNTAVDGSAVANSVTLTVPKTITTRSETQKPSALFQSGSKESSQETEEESIIE